MIVHSTREQLEARLRADLARHLRDRLRDEKLFRELYRALTNRAWRLADEAGPAHLTLSFKRAEELINDLRRAEGEAPLVLAQTGGEGELSDTVAGELERLGRVSEPADTDHRDEWHLWSEEDPPPPDTGKRFAPGPPRVVPEPRDL